MNKFKKNDFAHAAIAITRLDEAQIHLQDSPLIYLPAAKRREAMAIAIVDGATPRIETLCKLISDPDTTNTERGSKIAVDIYNAIQLTEKWKAYEPNISDIVELFSVADTSSGRLMRTDVQWSIEEDAMWVIEQMKTLAEDNTPENSVEMIRQIWISGRFLGTARKMSLLLAPWAIAKGFNCRHYIYGLSEDIKLNVEQYREAGQNNYSWNEEILSSMIIGYSKEYQKLKNTFAERTALFTLCPPTRSSSSIDNAINFVFAYPTFSANFFSKHLDLTPRGAKIVLDRLLETNVIEVDTNSRNRKFTCRRTL